MGELISCGIASKETPASRMFEELIKGKTFLTVDYSSPQKYVAQYWSVLKNTCNHTLYNSIFEYIVYTLIYREGIRPFYIKAHSKYAPIVDFEVLFCDVRSTLISLSLKTSLRERYKQADLEAIALKYVHRKSKCYLLTMDAKEANVQKEKILSGDIIGLDEIVDCTSDDINKLISSLKSLQFTTSRQIDIVKGNLID